MKESLPKITGILLAGGKSSRMFGDKGIGFDKKMDLNEGVDHDRGKGTGMGQEKWLIRDKENFRDKGKVRDTGIIRDKGMIRLGKFLMYQYPLKVLESLCDEILISTCNPMKIDEDYEQVCDKIPGIGPIGGVIACLEKSSNDLNIILSYDLPLVNRELFIELLYYSGEPGWQIINSSPNNDVITPKFNTNLTDEPIQVRNRSFAEDPSIISTIYDLILPSASPGRPEPLCGIYRKSTIPALHQMIDQGIFAMHQLIPRVHAKILTVGAADPFYHDRLFKNINTESDLSELPEQLL